jgi:RimJ/RimL family protein N-acetyltransferase
MPAIFDPSETYILEDDCVLLRPLQPDDCGNLLEFALHEPEIWKYSLIKAAGEANLNNYIRLALEARESGKEYPFIVFDKRVQEYAGSTRFYDIQITNQSLQLGYTWYAKKFQGTGLNKHCKFLLLQLAFERWDMKRVEFRADAGNARSIAAMKSIGCVEEGILRSHAVKPDGTRRDSIVLSILQSEWETGVKERLRARL